MKRWRIAALLCTAVVAMSMALVGCQTQEYTPQPKDQKISSSALGQAGTLRVGVNASSAPLAGQTSSSSRIVGIDVDVAAYLADELGTKVEVKDVGTDPTSALENGDVDIVLGVDTSDSDVKFWTSDPYISTGVALFGAQNESAIPTPDSSPKIAAQVNSKSSWRVTNLFGDDSLIAQNDLKSAFEALAKGDAKYVAADAVIGTYVSFSNGYSDKIVAVMQEPSGYCAGIAEGNTELQSAIASAMKRLTSGGMMEVIEKKWLGTAIDFSGMTVIKGANTDAKAAASGDENAENSEGDTPAEGEGAEGGEGADGGVPAEGQAAVTEGASEGEAA